MPFIKPNQKIFLKIIFLFCFFNSLLINAFCVSDNNLTLTEENNMPEILNLEIKLGKHIYNIGEPILIECNIVNIGQNSINLSPILFNDLEIYLKHENDKEYAPFGPIILLKELIRKEGIIKLGPGQNHSFIRKIDEKAYVMFNKLGRYEIYLTYSNLMKDLENVKLWVGEIKSNAVQFEIQNHRQQTQQAKPS